MGSGTFLGEAQIAAGYGFRNGLILSNGIGRTRALDGINIYQFNFTVEYETLSPKQIRSEFQWRPLALNATFVYGINREFFVRAPSQYPTRTYYPPTALQGLFGLSSFITWTGWTWPLSLGLRINVSDKYLIARFNNLGWHSEFCCSSGLSAKVEFP